jgi:hypothetical protein
MTWRPVGCFIDVSGFMMVLGLDEASLYSINGATVGISR